MREGHTYCKALERIEQWAEVVVSKDNEVINDTEPLLLSRPGTWETAWKGIVSALALPGDMVWVRPARDKAEVPHVVEKTIVKEADTVMPSDSPIVKETTIEDFKPVGEKQTEMLTREIGDDERIKTDVPKKENPKPKKTGKKRGNPNWIKRSKEKK